MAVLQNKPNFYRILSDVLRIGRALELLASFRDVNRLSPKAAQSAASADFPDCNLDAMNSPHALR